MLEAQKSQQSKSTRSTPHKAGSDYPLDKVSSDKRRRREEERTSKMANGLSSPYSKTHFSEGVELRNEANGVGEHEINNAQTTPENKRQGPPSKLTNSKSSKALREEGEEEISTA